MKTILLATTLLTASLLIGCNSIPILEGEVATDSVSIGKVRGQGIATMSKAQQEQYKDQQDIELREAQLQAEKARLKRENKQRKMKDLKETKDWLKTILR